MSEGYEPLCVERILVSLDSSKHSFAALKAAVQLARHYDATLRGVFVEDTTLLSLAEMPFRQEVGEYTAIVRDLSTDGLTRGILVQSRWVIRTFRKLINQTEIQGDVSVLRGNVSKTIQKESEECDLLILGKSGTNPLQKHRLGSTTKALIREQKRALLLVEEDNRLGYPMIVLYDDSALGRISLETALDLHDPQETLIVLINKDDPDIYQNHKNELMDWASRNEIDISIQAYHARSFERFLQMINGLKIGLLILPQINRLPERRIVELCLENATLPILLIRTSLQT